MKKALILFLLLPFIGFSQNATLVKWRGFNGSTAATTYMSNVSAQPISGAGGVNVTVDPTTNGTSTKFWSPGNAAPNAIDTNKYIQFTVSAASGYMITLDKFNFRHTRLDGGPQNYTVKYSLNTDFSNPVTPVNNESLPNSFTDKSISLGGTVIPSGGTLYIRIYAYNNSNIWWNEGIYRFAHVDNGGNYAQSYGEGPEITGTVTSASSVIAANDTASVTETQATFINVLANDTYTGTTNPTVEIVTPPTAGSAVVQQDKTIKFTAPTVNTTTTYTFTYKVTGVNNANANATVTVTVNPFTSPTAVNGTATTGQNIPVSVTVTTLPGATAGAGTINGVAIVNQPASGIATVTNNNTIVYTPTASFTGTAIITYKLTDTNNKSSNTATLTVTVQAIQAPTAVADSYNIAKNSTANLLDVIANDNMGNSAFASLQVVTGPTHGTATVNGNKIAYTPTNGYTGTDSFTYKVTNAYNASSAATTVSLDVIPASPTGILCGEYTVGTGGDFATITAAVNHLNQYGVQCSVTFLLTNNAATKIYNTANGEVFPITINTNVNNPTTATKTVTFKPAAGKNVKVEANRPVTIGGYTGVAAVFKLNGADYITFDGSNTAGGSTRNLVLVNSSYAGNDVHSNNSNDYTDRTVLWLASNDTDGVTNVTVKNVQIKQTYKNNPDRYCVGIFAGTNTLGQSNMLGTGEAIGAISNITINGNDFVNVKEGIYFNGGTTNISTNVTIFDNDLGSENNQESVLSPIALNNVNTFNIYENYIYKLYRDTNAASLATGGITINGLSRNGNIYKNDIKDLKRPTANQQILAGIVLNSSYSQDNNIKVYNNFILDVSTLGNSGGYSNGYGIVVDQGTGYKIYHNTVVLTPASNQTVNERNYSAALYVSAGVTALDVRNNIFVNTQTSPLTEKFAIIVNSPGASTFSYLNYNNLYSTQYIGFYGTTAGLTAGNNPNYYATFDGWQNNTLKDANSKNVNPAFASATDLHINAYSTQNNGFVDAGTPAIYSTVSKDIDGQVRKTSAPDMGADEFGQIAAVTPGTSPGLANNPGITCDSSTTWNGTAQGWSNGLPEIGKDVIFNADFTQSGGTLEACSIYVLAGKSVNVSGSATVTVNHSVNVETTGFLTFASSAHLIQLTDDQNSGIATVKRNSGLLQKLDYTIWSAPVTDARTSGFQSLQAFSPATLSNRFYYYNTPVNAYTPYATPETVKFIKGKGLLIRMPNTIAGNTTYNNGTSRVVWEGSFEGTPNNGTIRIPLEYTSDANSYNAVGNPYPSPINIQAFINENAGNSGVITGTLWLWRKTNDTNLSSYATVNLTAYAANSGGNNGGNTLIEDPYLVGNGTFNTAQGFIVKATAPNKELIFKNNMRNATGHSSAFFRTLNNEDGTTTTTDGFEGDRVWLNVKNAGTFSQAVIAYSPNTTNGYDNGYDGEVLVSGNLNLYSMLTTEAGVTRMTIQAKNTFNDTDVVPMGYIATVAGTYEIEIDHTDGVFAQGQDVYLKDNMLGTSQKLNSGSYSFTTEAGTFNGRFEVVYKAQGQLGTDIPVVDAKDVIAYRDGNQIKVTSTEVLASVSVYDVLGKKLFTKNNIGSTEFATADLNIAQQVVIINITLDNNQVISKKIMMN